MVIPCLRCHLFGLFLLLSVASATETPLYDVAIIGSGPAGLAAAIGIQRSMGKETSIAIFERSSALREVGGQVGLIKPAFQALDALDPSGGLNQAVRDAGIQRKIFRMLDIEGDVVSEMRMDKGDERQSVVIPWFQLQKVLCNAFLKGSSDRHTLNLGFELETLEELDDDVLMTFKNGHQCRAKVVIGADGNLSRVRTMLFEQDAIPEYAGSCIWRMFLKGEYDGIELGESNVWTGDGKVLAIQKMGSGDDSRLYVSGQAAWVKDQLHILDRTRYIGTEDGNESGTTRNEDRMKRFLEAFKDFPPQVLEFARKHQDTGSILEHPIYFRPVGRPWGKGRVTLVGDAAHIIPPNMAMGTPLAFEDSVSLAQNLHRRGLSSSALRDYEEERQSRVNKIGYRAIKDSGLYYVEKDDNSNPFKMNDSDMFEYIMNFQQGPVPRAFDSSHEIQTL